MYLVGGITTKTETMLGDFNTESCTLLGHAELKNQKPFQYFFCYFWLLCIEWGTKQISNYVGFTNF